LQKHPQIGGSVRDGGVGDIRPAGCRHFDPIPPSRRSCSPPLPRVRDASGKSPRATTSQEGRRASRARCVRQIPVGQRRARRGESAGVPIISDTGTGGDGCTCTPPQPRLWGAPPLGQISAATYVGWAGSTLLAGLGCWHDSHHAGTILPHRHIE
jgi:hypothetical protein